MTVLCVTEAANSQHKNWTLSYIAHLPIVMYRLSLLAIFLLSISLFVDGPPERMKKQFLKIIDSYQCEHTSMYLFIFIIELSSQRK